MSRSLDHGRVKQYDVLRVVTTLLVVISHGHYHQLLTPYGGVDYSSLMAQGSFSWAVLGFVTEFINTFTMPTFMALGGALFYRSMEKGKYSSLGALAADKAKRLLIPFLVVSVCYSFPLKLLSGYYASSDSVLLDFLLGQLLVGGNTHLWYLPAMFVDFLICYVLEVHVKLPKLLKLAALAVLSLLMWRILEPVNLVVNPLRFVVWFYAGYCFESVRKQVGRYCGGLQGVILFTAMTVVFLISRQLLDPFGLSGVVRQIGLKLVVPAMAGLSLYALSCGLANTDLIRGKVYDLFSRNTFGIYLYSDPVNYVVLCIGAGLCGPFLFANGVGVFVLYALRILITLGCSVLVSELLRRCKVKYIV